MPRKKGPKAKLPNPVEPIRPVRCPAPDVPLYLVSADGRMFEYKVVRYTAPLDAILNQRYVGDDMDPASASAADNFAVAVSDAMRLPGGPPAPPAEAADAAEAAVHRLAYAATMFLRRQLDHVALLLLGHGPDPLVTPNDMDLLGRNLTAADHFARLAALDKAYLDWVADHAELAKRLPRPMVTWTTPFSPNPRSDPNGTRVEQLDGIYQFSALAFQRGTGKSVIDEVWQQLAASGAASLLARGTHDLCLPYLLYVQIHALESAMMPALAPADGPDGFGLCERRSRYSDMRLDQEHDWLFISGLIFAYSATGMPPRQLAINKAAKYTLKLDAKLAARPNVLNKYPAIRELYDQIRLESAALEAQRDLALATKRAEDAAVKANHLVKPIREANQRNSPEAEQQALRARYDAAVVDARTMAEAARAARARAAEAQAAAAAAGGVTGLNDAAPMFFGLTPDTARYQPKYDPSPTFATLASQARGVLYATVFQNGSRWYYSNGLDMVDATTLAGRWAAGQARSIDVREITNIRALLTNSAHVAGLLGTGQFRLEGVTYRVRPDIEGPATMAVGLVVSSMGTGGLVLTAAYHEVFARAEAARADEIAMQMYVEPVDLD
ncbi:hypothetical protein H9P43_002539 [Blastocladiella emersonii ATCC 22665]|nr:hypothetical protein H9P43_002539 [Blastocladiella emersonii ATCC 22665]